MPCNAFYIGYICVIAHMKAIVQNVDASVELRVFDTFPRTDKIFNKTPKFVQAIQLVSCLE